jgi:hypothetical protein
MPTSERETLLLDVLRDPNYEAFRREALDLCRCELRRGRRKVIPVPFWMAIAAALLMVAFLAGRSRRPEQTAPVTASVAPAPPTDGRPLIAWVYTQALDPLHVVRSFPDSRVSFSTSTAPFTARRQQIEIVHSTTASFTEINDEQLLAMFPDQPAGFVQTSHGRELVLFDRMQPPDGSAFQ